MRGRKPKWTTETCGALLKSEGYTLKTFERSANGARLCYSCPQGHEHTVLLDGWRRGARCPECKRTTLSNSILKDLHAHGWCLRDVSDQPKRYQQRLKLFCPNGHVADRTYANFTQNKGCKQCDNAKRKVSYQEVVKLFNGVGYRLHLQEHEYKETRQTVTFTCPHGFTHTVRLNSFMYDGTRCPCDKCSSYGFDLKSPATLYCIEFETHPEPLIKIGITGKTLKQRFIKEPLPYTVIWTRKYKTGAACREEEKRLHERYARYRYNGVNVLRDGNTELFYKAALTACT